MDALATIAEVVAWISLPLAAVFIVVTLLLGAARGPWASAPAEVSGGQLRWFSADGELHTATADEYPELTQNDALVIHYRTRRPRQWHPEPVAHDERSGRIAAIILGAVGAVATVASTVLSMA